MTKEISRAIKIYNEINGYSEYYSDINNWNNIKNIYFIGDEGFMVIKEYNNHHNEIWLICYRKINILMHLMTELAKDSYGDKVYVILGGGNNIKGPFNDKNIVKWFTNMSFDVTYNDNIMLQLSSKKLRHKFIINTG